MWSARLVKIYSKTSFIKNVSFLTFFRAPYTSGTATKSSQSTTFFASSSKIEHFYLIRYWFKQTLFWRPFTFVSFLLGENLPKDIFWQHLFWQHFLIYSSCKFRALMKNYQNTCLDKIRSFSKFWSSCFKYLKRQTLPIL